tara:strand:+ start:480 stop:848 length:369 start_codon:yes stop_codon:yes gene_type:complete
LFFLNFLNFSISSLGGLLCNADIIEVKICSECLFFVFFLKNEADILENHFHVKGKRLWCEYKVSVRVLVSVLFLMMSVIYTTTRDEIVLKKEREREKFVVKISSVFFFGFSSVVVLFFYKPH